MYDLEINKAIGEIKKHNALKVLIQLPDGLKPRANEIIDKINSKTNADLFIWFGQCFGACDLPLETEAVGVDLILTFGHSIFKKEYW